MYMFIYAINCISVYLAVAFYCSLGAGNALKILLFQHKMTFGLHLLLSLPTKVPAAVTQRRVALACLAHKFRCFFWKLSDLCGFWYIFFSIEILYIFFYFFIFYYFKLCFYFALFISLL